MAGAARENTLPRQARLALPTIFRRTFSERNSITMTSRHTRSALNSSKRLALPCLSLIGTRVFAPTADQRFLAGSAEFLRTHFPIRLQSRCAGLPATVTEQSLLHRLLQPDPTVVGNRVFVLYGAA